MSEKRSGGKTVSEGSGCILSGQKKKEREREEEEEEETERGRGTERERERETGRDRRRGGLELQRQIEN